MAVSVQQFILNLTNMYNDSYELVIPLIRNIGTFLLRLYLHFFFFFFYKLVDKFNIYVVRGRIMF
jgi:hypothetical protein